MISNEQPSPADQSDGLENGSSTEQLALKRLSLFGLLDELTGPDHILAREFGPSRTDRTNLFADVRDLSGALNDFHGNAQLRVANCFTTLHLDGKTPQYTFDTGNMTIVQISRRAEYHSFSTSISYDESQMVTAMNLSYFNGDETVRIVPDYNQDRRCVGLTFSVKGYGGEVPVVISFPTDPIESLVQNIFPPQNPTMGEDIVLGLEDPKLVAVAEPQVRRSGIVYDNWEQLREALILFGEGNITQRGELTGSAQEGQAFLDAGLADVFAFAHQDPDKTHRVAEWVDEHFRDNPEGERSFDYEDFTGLPNNFHKCQVQITYMPDGKYLLRIFQGQNGDMPETQLAQATLQERVVTNVSQTFVFPHTDDYFLVGGLEQMEEKLSAVGSNLSWSGYWALVQERMPLEAFYNPERDILPYDYIYGSKPLFAPSFESEGMRITLNFNLPRESRVGFEVVKGDDGKLSVQPYDSWSVHPSGDDEREIIGRVGRNSSGRKNLPTVTVSVAPASLKAPEADDTEKMLQMADRMKQLLESVSFS